MPATSQDITHYAGDSARITIAVTDADGNPVDLSAASARWWMGKSVTASGADVYIKKANGSGLAITALETDKWSVIVTLDPADTEGLKTGTFYHECEVVDALDHVSTVAIGKFVLKPTLIPDNL